MADRWLEAELARQFCPVSAPDALWRQIHEQRRPLRVRPSPWMTWSIAIASLLILAAGLVWRLGMTGDPSGYLEALAGKELRELADGSDKMDIRSGDALEIQRWVKAKAGIDIEMPGHSAFGKDAIRLLGARIIESQGSSVAVISYRVGDDSAAMLVADRHAGLARSATPAHTSLRSKSAGDASLYSWNVGADDYAIAFSGTKDSQRACLLCHAGPPASMVFR